MTWLKTLTVQSLLAHGVNVVHSDVDVSWLRDPLPYFLDQACPLAGPGAQA
jgi:hypothetical protein